jgi:hypothetical protein
VRPPAKKTTKTSFSNWKPLSLPPTTTLTSRRQRTLRRLSSGVPVLLIRAHHLCVVVVGRGCWVQRVARLLQCGLKYSWRVGERACPVSLVVRILQIQNWGVP